MSKVDPFSKVFGNSPKEDPDEFFKRHGVGRDDYLPYLEELNDLARSLNFFDPVPGHVDGTVVNSRLSPFNLFYCQKNIEHFGIDIKDFYVANSRGLRSDEFGLEHDGLHVLFAGCSITFGDSMMLENTWAYKTYSMLSNVGHVSGYYNVGINGGTILQVIAQVFKYIKEFGKPDVVFLNLPDIERETGHDQSPERILEAISGAYIGLSEYCKLAGIELYAFTWDQKANKNPMITYDGKDPRLVFDNFYTFDVIKDRHQHMFQYQQSHQDSVYHDYMLKAFDYVHPGIAEHDFYASFIFNKFIENSELL